MKKSFLHSFGFAAAVTAAAVVLSSCAVAAILGSKGKTYKVEYEGSKDWYKNARDSYKAGEKVVIYYPFVATDTSYSFELVGGELSVDYSDDKGYILSFIMPENDVRLICKTRNTMLADTEPEKEEVLLFDYYNAVVATVGGDRHDELAVYSYTDSEVKLRVYTKDSPEDEEVCTEYTVPKKLVDECLKLCSEYKLDEWQGMKDGAGITGAVVVVKYRAEDGSYVRASTECMPQDGKEKLNHIGSVIRGYIREEYKD